MADNLPAPARAADRPLLPAEFDDQLRARLAALDAASDKHARDLRPGNTVRSYASDWKTWTAFCQQLQIPLTAATRGTLCAFVDYLWTRERRAATTIDRKLAGVSVTLRRDYGIALNKEDTKSARELLKDYQRRAAEAEEPARGRGKAPAMRVEVLRQIVAKCSDDIFGVRDRAMLLLGFALAARRAELAGLRLRNVIRDADGHGLLVHVTVSKTSPRTVPVPYGQDPATCPVRAWETWVEKAQLADPDRHAFRAIHASGSVQPKGITPQRVGDIITAAGARARIPVLFTGHSVRSGMATEARRAGKDRKAIAKVTGHKPNSAVLDGYMQIVDQWGEQDNALVGLL
ncbi:tyrosine-type recombinase/integrase [Streptomyces sp. NPDC048350]|uniref:tyrosine-type recombinase/integrase n=1 Tax=Streptomyces sp. NPDC048350 TaxID=3365538 RepID=UPI0037237B89